MENLIFSINTVLPVFLMIAAGYVLKRLNVLDESFSNIASKFVFVVALPMLLFKNVSESDFSGIFNKELLNAILVAVISTVIIFLILIITSRRYFDDEKKRGAFIQGSFRGNYALLGIPLIYNIASSQGVIAASMIAAFILPLYNILAIIALSLHRKTSMLSMLKLVIRNPLVIAIVTGVVAAAVNLRLPKVASDMIDMFAGLAMPLALLSIGVFFDMEKFLKNFKISVSSTVIKTVIIPMIFTPVAYLLGLRGVHLISVFVLFGAPTAVSSYIMAKGMDCDEQATAGMIILSTTVSLFTFFIGIYIFKAAGII